MAATLTAESLDRAAERVVDQPTPVELDLDARMALTVAAMSAQLLVAAVAWEVNASLLPAGPDWSDTVTLPADPAPHPEPDHATPVAALLQRAHRRMATGGWCRGYAVDGQGATCLQWAIHREARGDMALEIAGLNHLLDQIRRDLDPGAQTVASWNDAQGDARMPLRILGAATDTAAQRGI